MRNLNVKFKERECVVEFGKYKPSGGTAITLIGAPGTEYEGEPIATASVNIYPEMYSNPEDVRFKFSKDLPENRCYIKTWSENEGILEALEQAGIVMNFFNTIDVGGYGSKAVEVMILDYPEE